ncbi:MAG: right-handed parallel beta-helix repeat-containing protein [bacterium]
MKPISCIFLCLLVSMVSFADVHHVPGDFNSISAAVAAVRPGDTVTIAPGTYRECITIPDSVSLAGEDPAQCILQGPGDQTVVTVSGTAQISGLTIQGGQNGVWVKADTSLDVENCRILGNKSDGVGFDVAFNTILMMGNCLVEGNGDGVDLESTQAVIRNSRFVNNRDDGLDLDGDAGALVYECTFADNGDDGIEIRLATNTHALIQKCRFERNGEDGIEIINSPREEGIYNLLCVQNSTFDSNERYGVGFVSQEEEIATEKMSKTAVYAVGNIFVGKGKDSVSPNYATVFMADKDYPRIVRITMTRNEKEIVQEIPLHIPLLVGIYNMSPTIDGTKANDLEGITVSDHRIFLADDGARQVYVLERGTGGVTRSFSTKPFPGNGYEAPGPEGLDIVSENGKEALLLTDDDGRGLYTLSLDDETYGHVIRRNDTTDVGPVEGGERIGDRLVLAANQSKLYQISPESFQPVAPAVNFAFDGFGTHIAGVGAPETNDRLFAIVSGYNGAQQTWRNHGSAFFELDLELTEVRGFWHLGPFSNDPRGIAVSDGLVYVADGRSDFTDERTGEVNRGGIKVFVFLRKDDPDILNGSLALLPIRHKTVASDTSPQKK